MIGFPSINTILRFWLFLLVLEVDLGDADAGAAIAEAQAQRAAAKNFIESVQDVFDYFDGKAQLLTSKTEREILLKILKERIFSNRRVTPIKTRKGFVITINCI